MQDQSGERGPRATWYLLFAAFVWLELLLVGFGTVAANHYVASGKPATGAKALAAICYMVTPLAVVASVYWARAKLSRSEGVDPKSFTRDTIVSMAIAELGLMFALIAFMRTDPGQLLLFGVIVMMVNFFIILRAGRRYWAAQDENPT